MEANNVINFTNRFYEILHQQGFEFVLVEDNTVINKDNVDEIDSILDKDGHILLDMRKITK